MLMNGPAPPGPANGRGYRQSLSRTKSNHFPERSRAPLATTHRNDERVATRPINDSTIDR
jgi:hypothetical protein